MLVDFVLGNAAGTAVFAADRNSLAALYRTAINSVADSAAQVGVLVGGGVRKWLR